MLDKLITRLRHPGSVAAVGASVQDPAQLALLFRHFPVGARLTYFVEQRRELQFSTLILGYRINGHDLYAQDAIELDDDDLPCAFRVDGRTGIPLARVAKLRLLLPDTSAHQGKLDYVTRGELGRDGHLSKGVTLTLRAKSLGRGVPIVETIVDRKETLADGPFAGQGTVLVEPDLEMIRVVDNRRKPRVRSSVDATLFHGEPAPIAATPCRLADFSDETLRLRAKAGALPALKSGATVEVEFKVETSAEPYRVRGKLQRQSEQGAVVRFAELLLPATTTWRKVEMLDVLEIKTALLNVRA